MRRLLLISTLLLVFLALRPAISAPVYNYEVRTFRSVIESFLPAGESVYVAFSNGTVALIDYSTGRVTSGVIKPTGLDSVGMFYSGSSLVVVDSLGLIAILDPSTLNVLSSMSAISRSDEMYVLRAALSGDGRFLALDVMYTYKGARLERLVIVDLLKGSRIFERDVNSNDVLCKVFSLDFYGNYLVAETIDTLCELCQLTDNKIEVYSVSPNGVVKVASFQTGLTIKAVGEGYVLAQQVKSENGQHRTLVLSLPDLKVVSEKMAQQAVQITPIGSRFVVVFQDGSVNYCDVSLSCSQVLKVPTQRSIGVFARDTIAVFTVSSVFVYATDYKNPPTLTASYRIEWPSVSWDPVDGKASGSICAAKYGNSFLAVVYPLRTSTIHLRVLDQDGNPLDGASVTLVGSSGTYSAVTNSSGWASLKVLPGNYSVEILRKGFSENNFPLTINQPTMFLETRMVKEPPKRYTLTVNVVGDNGKPLPGARVTIEGPESYELLTPASGTLSVELLRGNYTVKAEAPLYTPQTIRFELKEQGGNLTLVLKKKFFNLTVISEANLSVTLKLVGVGAADSAIEVKTKGEPVTRIKLAAGSYIVTLIDSPKGYSCRLNTTTVEWRDTTDQALLVNCSPVKAENRASLAEIIESVRSEVQLSRNVSKTISLGTITLYNGQLLDLASLSRERTLVVELFYTQCTGCKYMIPLLRSLSQRNDTVVISLTVSPSDTPEILRRYMLDNNITWYIGRDDVQLASQVNATSFPTVLVVKEGSIVFMGVGSKRELEELARAPSLISLESLVAPETLIILGCALILVTLAVGGGGAKEKGQVEESDIWPYSSHIHSLHTGLRGDYT
ncbi:carboxypeptidase regulatory-like domain-containing protein [Infirmifilum sp. SLHALR2]|nr:MAG: hypothetical protein B7L53_02500 [Thermofilum sp. NZ13]